MDDIINHNNLTNNSCKYSYNDNECIDDDDAGDDDDDVSMSVRSYET